MLQLPANPSLRQCRTKLIEALEEAGAPSAELDARLLLRHALLLSDMAYFTNAERILGNEELGEIEALLQRRLLREPISRIIGSRGFWKHDFVLGSETLDPRPDSETLIEAALDLLDQCGRMDEPLFIVDLGTGSGALILSLLSELPNATGLGVDIEEGALEIARQNADAIGCSNRVELRQGDWLQGIERQADIILCNPPYIPAGDIDGLEPEVAQYDPRRALDGGADGLDPYRTIFPQLHSALKPDGFALFEFGDGQYHDIARLALDAGLFPAGGEIGLYMDLAGRWRAIGVSLQER